MTMEDPQELSILHEGLDDKESKLDNIEPEEESKLDNIEPEEESKLDNIEPEEESKLVNIEPKGCIFCPTKIITSTEIVTQYRKNVCKQCHYCSLICSKLTEQISKQEKGRYFCSNCTVEGVEFHELAIHLRQHYSNEPCICTVKGDCENEIKIEVKVENVLDISSEKKEKKICDKVTEVPDKRFKCRRCDYRTKNKSDIEAHVRTHTRFNCDQCKYKTINLSRLHQHSKTHGSKDCFKCAYCEFSTKLNHNLKLHLQRMHTKEMPYHCNRCDYKTLFLAYLKKHLIKHTGEKPFPCDLCDFKTTTVENLRMHTIRIHVNDKQFCCDQCDYKTSDRSYINRHKRKHTGEKPFQCTECDYKGAFRAGLKRHILTTHREKACHCNQCDYKTSNNTYLKRHMVMSHTEEKPFQCEECKFQCKFKAQMRRHMKVHSGIKPYHCHHCVYKTITNSNLKGHHIRIHPDVNETGCEHCQKLNNS